MINKRYVSFSFLLSPFLLIFNDFLRLKVSFLTKKTKNEVVWTVYVSYTSKMAMFMLNEKIAPSPFPSFFATTL